jgi:CRISPR type III-A-associated protein Csm2
MANPSVPLAKRQCEICKKLFQPKEPWHKTCFDCAQKERADPRKANGISGELQQKFDGYLKQLSSRGYFDERENLRAAFRVEDAQLVAQVLAQGGVTTSQLRRFFTMARALEQRLGISMDFPTLVPEIARFQPMVASLVGREQNQRQRDQIRVLQQFIDCNAVKARESEQSFRKGFLPHFEAVVAYFTYYKPK